MGLAIFSFCAVFLLLASGGVLLFYRETMLRRVAEAINPRPKPKTLRDKIQQTGTSLGTMVEHLEHMLPKSQAEVSIVMQRMTQAGFRGESAPKIFYGCKVLVPLLLCAVALLTGLAKLSPFFVYASCLGVGFLVPDFWLSKRIAARQKRLRRGLPDVLDLLVVCVEAGLSLDQATARTAAELTKAQPELCDELNVVALEQRAGRARSDAWRNLAARTGEENLRNLVSMLVQAEQLGTSVAKTLRVHSETLRTQRVQAIEELAAKTSVKLVFPLVFFIFPALFLVTLGPAVILMTESFKSFLSH
jgi:tight adherence protein C